MTTTPSTAGLLATQLDWFIRLRWLAAIGVIVGSVAGHLLVAWHDLATRGVVLGVIIALHNLIARRLLSGAPHTGGQRRMFLLKLASAQILIDLACLTLLAIWSGGVASPVSGFFVFHMVFASLLLPQSLAYAGAATAVLLMGGGLAATGQWPAGHHAGLIAIGWVLTLTLTVYLTSRITRTLRDHQRRLVRQNRRVRAMTGKLRRQQENMVQHEKMVAMGQMAAGITHEIANPLASMDSLLQLMLRRPERMGAQSLETLRAQIQRIHQIIQQMKAFAHPADELQVRSVNEVVGQAMEVLRFDRRIKPMAVTMELADDVGDVPMLPQLLQQVLVNLIMNALDALEAVESPRLIVRTARRDGWIYIEVDDNGPGILPEHMKRIFEPFFTTKPVGKGTGLGLSISYSLTRKQGGRLQVRSEVGVGTTFTVMLPVEGAVSRNREPSGGHATISEKPA